MSEILDSLSREEVLPSLGARGKESGKWPWESRDSGWTLRAGDPGEGAAAAVSGKWLGTLAPGTAQREIGLVGLFRDRSRRPWADPNVPRPEQTRKCERKFGKNVRNPVREEWMNDGCARLIGPRTVTTSSRGRVRVVRNPWNVMARLAEVVGRNGTSEGSVCTARGSRDPIVLVAGMGCCSCGWNGVLGTSNGKSKPGNGLRGWEICRLGCLVIFGLSRVGWLPEYRVVFRQFWPVLALARDGRVSGNGLGFERILVGDWLEREGE
ncbi:hypothetical protein CDL15_Pgr028308 [Punica granatum]|uniref:Uncharacterized protein n=1 Tax=Punica granatum TaxID=22663 RepID=A0A218WWS5_PUNGR|nr:hypothetical protein CDL15_Pgr028308 [Punica granatum]